ncbi:MAG TPA: hypothetical protein VH054_16675 [Polyangiaceae bacterium]|nr:hypothetical protein [Polyangiaceae bacterium]
MKLALWLVQSLLALSRWETQRKALAVAKDADFAAALEQARALWPTFAGNEIGQSSLAYAFPDEYFGNYPKLAKTSGASAPIASQLLKSL